MSVVGFDVGNDNSVIAVVKQRGIDVLINDESTRETPRWSLWRETKPSDQPVLRQPHEHEINYIPDQASVGRNFRHPDVQTISAALDLLPPKLLTVGSLSIYDTWARSGPSLRCRSWDASLEPEAARGEEP
ncbi:hypothetical protein HPP92_012865 [Vanilla planifolia]|uniref:Uncharacterized protein n=1 Tax=Vanilla planifolia TaxID=51239 RepID=A0A835QRB7_VANPL|nr:hypothetical protein HPP92_012865 [Vanilla planifolia]